MSARSTLRKALRRIGLERRHTPSFVDLMHKANVETILDVGANEGQYVHHVRELGYKGRIISFEPIVSVFEKLKLATIGDPLWDAHNCALGDEAGNAAIQVSEETVFSSFRQQTRYLSAKFEGSASVRSESVRIERLDEFLDRNPEAGKSTYLKIDTQGFEKQVLQGCGHWLERLKVIQLELPIENLYVGQATWLEMVQWMMSRGFAVAMAKENSYDWTRMQLLELDVVFVKAG